MALRVVEVYLPTDARQDFLALVEELGCEPPLSILPEDGRTVFRLVLPFDQVGLLVDAVDSRFGATEGFRLLILAAEAQLPRAEVLDERTSGEGDENAAVSKIGATGVSREELYANVQHMTTLDRTFVATVVLSTVVASVGMLRDSMAVLIGAMVIAPLLGPNVALALATTLADTALIRSSARANLVGVLLAFAIAVGLGLSLKVDPTLDAIASRTEVQLSDIVLALASGGAAVLALTRGLSSALVGVMVAVALLPPTVAVGLMLGSGRPVEAVNAAMLLLVNVICVNLAGVVTFLVQGVGPRRWWEAKRARRMQRMAIATWVVLLGILSVLITLSTRWI